jgi:maleylpyruvate isomerase
VTVDPLGLAADVTRADERLLATAATLDDTAVRSPSALPGWTRGHVLAHIARNADSYVNLLTWARTGVETPMYPSVARRNADIEAGAGRPLAEHVADLTAAAERFAAAVEAMTPAAWVVPVRHLNGRELRPPQVVWGRLREIEVHHVDLDAGYGPGDWSDAFTLHLLREIVGEAGPGWPVLRVSADDLQFSATIRAGSAGAGAETGTGSAETGAETGAGSAPVEVRGPARALAAWLIGRSNGDDLSHTGDGALPDLPNWK